MLWLSHRFVLLFILVCFLFNVGCPPPTEGFEAELRFVTPLNQSPMQSIDSLEISFTYVGETARDYLIDAPFPREQILEDLPRAEAGELRVDVAGLVADATADGGYRTVATGWAEDFPMPPDEPIELYFALKGQIGQLDGGLAHARSDATVKLLDDGRVVVIGGLDGNGTVAPVEVLFEDGLDLTQPVSVTTYGDLPRICHAAFLISDSGTSMDGKVVVVGGDTDGTDHLCYPDEEAAMDVVAFDPDSGEIETLSTLDAPMMGMQGVDDLGEVYPMFGGYTVEGSLFDPEYVPFTQPWQFNPESGAVEERDDFGMVERVHHRVTLFDEAQGEVLVTGGIWLQNQADNAERWTDSGGDSSGGELVDARIFHTATALDDRKVLVAGGAQTTDHEVDGTAIASAELWVQGGFTLLADSMASARQRHAAAPVGTQAALLCGGVVVPGATPLDNCEYFDFDEQSFTTLSTVPLNPGGEGMMALPLGDGRVLLLGGMNGNTALDQIYIYNP